MKMRHIKSVVQPDMRNGPLARGMPENKTKAEARAKEKGKIRCRDDTALPLVELLLIWHNSVKQNCYTGPPGRNGPGLKKYDRFRSGGTMYKEVLKLSG